MPDVKPVQEGRFHTWNSWRKNDLKYHLSFTRDIPVAEQERIFTAAFKQYADASPNLKLTRVKTPAEADIKVRYVCQFASEICDTRTELPRTKDLLHLVQNLKTNQAATVIRVGTLIVGT